MKKLTYVILLMLSVLTIGCGKKVDVSNNIATLTPKETTVESVEAPIDPLVESLFQETSAAAESTTAVQKRTVFNEEHRNKGNDVMEASVYDIGGKCVVKLGTRDMPSAAYITRMIDYLESNVKDEQNKDGYVMGGLESEGVVRFIYPSRQISVFINAGIPYKHTQMNFSREDMNWDEKKYINLLTDDTVEPIKYDSTIVRPNENYVTEVDVEKEKYLSEIDAKINNIGNINPVSKSGKNEYDFSGAYPEVKEVLDKLLVSLENAGIYPVVVVQESIPLKEYRMYNEIGFEFYHNQIWYKVSTVFDRYDPYYIKQGPDNEFIKLN